MKYTSRVRRGLALLYQIGTLTEDDPPRETVMSRWSKAQQGDYNLALDWIEQETQPKQPEDGQEGTDGSSAPASADGSS